MFDVSRAQLKTSFVWPSKAEWWQAIRYVLLVVTVIIMVTMMGSLISYERVIAEGHPWLPRIQCPGCPLCGMTRSFCAMSAGRVTEAWRLNRGGPALYSFGWIWLAGAVLLFVQKIRKINARGECNE